MATLKRVAANDPRRCQASGGAGQCPFEAVPGLIYCLRHCGHQNAEKARNENIRVYQLAKWQDQLDRQAGNPNIKSLREEIGILRMTLQEKLNSCHTQWDLMANAGPISELVMKIQILVRSCHQIEKELGELLDKAQALQLATSMVEVIAQYIDDPDILNAIAEDLAKKVQDVLNSAHAAA